MNVENLCFAGGGIKGYSYIGVIEYLEQGDYLKNVKKISGTSIGALTALLVTLGYSYEELKNIALNINLNLLEDVDINLFLGEYGLDNGKKITHLLNYFVKFKNYKSNISFKELYEITGIHLFISCCDISSFKDKVFDYNNTPDISVVLACRYSMNIPLLWTLPEEKYIDGCFSKNIPIEVLPVEKTLGFYCSNSNLTDVLDIKSYLTALINCSLSKGVSLEIEKYKRIGYKIITIPSEIGAVDINLSLKQKTDIIHSGYISLKKYE